MDQVFEIDQIVDARFANDQWEYLIKWKYYPESRSTWENAENIDSSATIDRFWEGKNKEVYKAKHLYESDITNSFCLPLSSVDLKKANLLENIEQILSVEKPKDVIFCICRVKGSDILIKVPSSVLKKENPKLLLRFYESLLKKS